MKLLSLRFLMWCLAHPAEVTMMVGALSSLCYQKMAKYPKMQAACEALAHAGVNVPALVNAALRVAKSMPVKTAAAVLVFFSLSHAACAALNAQDKGDLGQYEAQQGACIAATPHDKAAIDACRAKVKAQWCAKWADRFDAGVCQ